MHHTAEERIHCSDGRSASNGHCISSPLVCSLSKLSFKRSWKDVSVSIQILPYHRGSFKQCRQRQVWKSLRDRLQIDMSSITTISTIRTHQRHVPSSCQTTNAIICCLWQVKTWETPSLVWLQTLWLYDWSYWSLSGCKAKPTRYLAPWGRLSMLISALNATMKHVRHVPTQDMNLPRFQAMEKCQVGRKILQFSKRS